MASNLSKLVKKCCGSVTIDCDRNNEYGFMSASAMAGHYCNNGAKLSDEVMKGIDDSDSIVEVRFHLCEGNMDERLIVIHYDVDKAIKACLELIERQMEE